MSDVFDVDERAERGAYNQALFREVNERIKELFDDPQVARDFGVPPVDPEWVCECANAACLERLVASRSKYAEVRSSGACFLVLPDESHVFADIEDVVDRQPGYWVLEKTGDAKVVAESLYERWHGGARVQ